MKSAEECKSTLLGKIDKEFNDRPEYLDTFLRDLLFFSFPRVSLGQTQPGGGIFTETAIQAAGTACLRPARHSAAGMANPGQTLVAVVALADGTAWAFLAFAIVR